MKSVLYSAYYVLGGTGGWLYTVNESQTNRRESTSIHNKPWDKKWLMYGAGDEGSGFDMIAYIWDWHSPSSCLWGGALASCLAKLGSRKNIDLRVVTQFVCGPPTLEGEAVEPDFTHCISYLFEGGIAF